MNTINTNYSSSLLARTDTMGDLSSITAQSNAQIALQSSSTKNRSTSAVDWVSFENNPAQKTISVSDSPVDGLPNTLESSVNAILSHIGYYDPQ